MFFFQIGPFKRHHLPSPIRERRAGPAFGWILNLGVERRPAPSIQDKLLDKI